MIFSWKLPLVWERAVVPKQMKRGLGKIETKRTKDTGEARGRANLAVTFTDTERMRNRHLWSFCPFSKKKKIITKNGTYRQLQMPNTWESP